MRRVADMALRQNIGRLLAAMVASAWLGVGVGLGLGHGGVGLMRRCRYTDMLCRDGKPYILELTCGY